MTTYAIPHTPHPQQHTKGSGVVISGASTGIGYHAAVALADAFVVYAGVRKRNDAQRLISLVSKRVGSWIRLVVSNQTEAPKADACLILLG